MATIDRELVRAINSGRCFAFVGAGPSCQVGVPSWSKLAEIAIASLDSSTHQSKIKRCQKLLAKKDYPAVFSVVEKAIGLKALLDLIKKTLIASKKDGAVYQHLARWPFAVYLTTNYDDYLATYVRNEQQSFVTKHNTQVDFRVLRADSKGVIFKIHGDCSTPDDIVLTEEQYIAFRKAPERNYWREKIRSVLHMVNVVLIGTSASDPDFTDQLEMAKDIASPDHPIFMFSADIPVEDIRRYFAEFNIRVIPYANPDGQHRQLPRILKRYDPFIAKRNAPHIGQDPIDEEQARIASSMHLFTRLNLADAQTSCLKKSYQALIVGSLGEFGPNARVSLEQLQGRLGKRLYVADVDPEALRDALEALHARGLIETSLTQGEYFLSALGVETLETTRAERQLRSERFTEACRLSLGREFPDLEKTVHDAVIQQIDTGLSRAFEKRGAEMAQATFGSSLLDLSTATDILETVNSQSSEIEDENGRAAFADLMLEILLQPAPEMKERLADLSQGYFSYHALGLDSRCSAERLEMAQSKAWIFDSSIILPLLAKDCVNHEFALDILERMKGLGLRLYTTERLCDEVIDHAYWAIKNFKDAPSDSPKVLQAAAGEPGYKQNLFIDGYMKWALLQGAPSLEAYLAACLGDYEDNLGECIAKRLDELGIESVQFSDWPDFAEEQWGDRERITNEIIELRKQRGTYRNDDQCRAEAEVLILCETQKAAFLSQSGVLDSIDRDKPRITWKPESMYRFLSSFSAVPPSEDLLYQSMVQDFFYSGFDIINSDTLREYFAGPVRQSRMLLDEEKTRYESALGNAEYNKLRSGYDHVPDTQKPFYSMQFAFYVARKESQSRERAEARARRAEEIKGLKDKERQHYDRLKAKETERSRKGIKKQRQQQSQKKGKKKEK